MNNGFISRFGTYLSFVKFAHTIFAMPFALVGVFYGYYVQQEFSWRTLILVVLAMVFARNAAMGFNRYIDRDIDAKNDRTKVREIPSGKLSPKQALAFVIINSVLFIITTFFINKLAFFLSPVALAVILGYSLTKRFTALCHFVLGLGLSLAPIGAFIAETGRFSLEVILLGVAVLTWVAGFDIIYALQDIEFDKKEKLYSIPAMVGYKKALVISKILHFLSAAFIVLFIRLAKLGILSNIGATIFILSLMYQHLVVEKDGLKKINLAFFTTNGIASLLFGVFVIADIWLKLNV